MKTVLITRLQVAAFVCAALVLVTGGAGLAQPAPSGKAAKPSPAKNIAHVATDGSGDYKTDGTDDQVEINQALADIHKKGGGTVHLKKGTYVISDTIWIISDNTVLEGDGWASVIKLKDNVGWPIRHSSMIKTKGPRRGITIRNLKIDGNAYKQIEKKGTDYYYDTMVLSGVTDLTISGLWIGHTTNDAMKLGGCKNVTVENNTIYDEGHECVYLCGGCNNVRIINNMCSTRHNGGLRIGSSNRVVARGNTIHSLGPPAPGGAGIMIERQANIVMDDILIEQNRIFGMPGAGILMSALPGKPTEACNVRIRNNLIYRTGMHLGRYGGGVNITGFNNVLVENNTIFNNGHGVWFSKRTRGDWPLKVVVRNNIIACNSGYGISTRMEPRAVVLSSYNNVWGNKLGSYEGSVEIERDTSVDPLFVYAPPLLERQNYDYKTSLKADFHLKSSVGRWNGTAWAKGAIDSPCIDAGSPSADHSKEPAPNGGRINLGGHGNTKEASKGGGLAKGTISGKITDKATGESVSGAKVSTGGYFGTTDANGKYTIVDAPAGRYSLKASDIRYVGGTQDNVEVSKDKTTVIDFTLEKEKVPPTVKSHSPEGKNPAGKIISVAFSEQMNTDLAEKSFSVSPSVAGSFRWIGSTMYFIPDKSLQYGTKYKITVEGAEDLAGNKLQSPCTWEFSTLEQAEHLVGEWRFEEDSGDIVKDSSGRGNNGILGGGRNRYTKIDGKPARVEGKVGKALSFDGVGDVVMVPHNDSLIVREEVTIEAWVKADHQVIGGGVSYGIVVKCPHRGYAGYQLLSYTGKVGKGQKFLPRLGYKAMSGAGQRITSERSAGAPYDSWVFLAVTRDFHGNVNIYVNGKQGRTVKTDPITEAIACSEQSLWIGWYVKGKHFKGLIDEVRVYNRALSPAEIKADYGRNK